MDLDVDLDLDLARRKKNPKKMVVVKSQKGKEGDRGEHCPRIVWIPATEAKVHPRHRAHRLPQHQPL